MIDRNVLEEVCPKCNGKGSIEKATWYHNLAPRNILETKDKLKLIKTKVLNEAPNQPDNSLFSSCRNCYGRGKILTAEGRRLIEFIKFWIKA